MPETPRKAISCSQSVLVTQTSPIALCMQHLNLLVEPGTGIVLYWAIPDHVLIEWC